jgi:hypothetical protein
LLLVAGTRMTDSIHHFVQHISARFGITITQVRHNVSRDYKFTVAKRSGLITINRGANLVGHAIRSTF